MKDLYKIAKEGKMTFPNGPSLMKKDSQIDYMIKQTVKREKQMKEKDTVRSGIEGRNNPCPCGSGRKYKRCCGKMRRK